MANLPFSLADLDILATADAYNDVPTNPKYAFKHLLFSVTEPQFRVKFAGVPNSMWEEAMRKLEDMEKADRERLWPQLVQGFKDLSQRLKIQDEVIAYDTKRLSITKSNVQMLRKHLQADILPWIQRKKQKEQALKHRLLRVMRIVEGLEGKGGCRIPLDKGEAELAKKLGTITQQLKGPGVNLYGKVQNLLMASRVQTSMDFDGSVHLPGSTGIHENSLAHLQKVIQQQTEAIAKLCSALKRDIRHMGIMKA